MRTIDADVTTGNSTISTALSPLVSEFENEEQEANYTARLKAKVQASLDDTRPTIAHDKVMFEARALLAAKRKADASN